MSNFEFEDDDDLLTPGEVAKRFRVDPKTVGRWATSKQIPSVRTPGGHRRYRAGDVRQMTSVPDVQLPGDEHTRYLLWSNRHQKWWCTNAFGYTDDRARAGRFTEAEAVQAVLASARGADVALVTCAIVDVGVASISDDDDDDEMMTNES